MLIPIIRNPANKKLLALSGSFILTAMTILVGNMTQMLLIIFLFASYYRTGTRTQADSHGDKTRQASAEATEQDRSTRTSTTRRKSLEQEAGAGIWETEVETYATHLGMDLKVRFTVRFKDLLEDDCWSCIYELSTGYNCPSI